LLKIEIFHLGNFPHDLQVAQMLFSCMILYNCDLNCSELVQYQIDFIFFKEKKLQHFTSKYNELMFACER